MPSRKERKRRRLLLWRRWWIALASLFTLVGLLLLAVLVVPLPQPRVSQASVLHDVNGVPYARLFTENRTPVPLSRVPAYLQDAVVAAEDDRFYRHFGLDPVGIARALVRNVLAGRVVEGGSTITRQLARNLYLSQRRTLGRKVREVFLTLQLEARYSKKEILAMYLNQIYLGEGACGVEAAAQTYFGKPVSQLTLAEAALLAGLPRAPELYNPFRNPQAALGRRNYVLDRMAALGMADPAAAARARGQPLRLSPRRPPVAAQFTDYVIQEVTSRHPELAADLHRGGYRIYTTMDVRMQAVAEDAVRRFLAPGKPDRHGVLQPQVALVAIGPRNGFIKAIVGSRDPAGGTFNRAVDARRLPGSAFKPFLYAAVLSTGYTLADQQVCEYVSFPGTRPGEAYVPKDYTEGGRRPPYHWRAMGIREAIEISDNVIAVKWAATVGPDAVAAMARRLGIESALEASLPLALGTSEVTPLEMATAYAPFANMGWRVKPLAVLRVEDARGRVLEENRPQLTKVLDEGVAYLINDALKGVIARDGRQPVGLA